MENSFEQRLESFAKKVEAQRIQSLIRDSVSYGPAKTEEQIRATFGRSITVQIRPGKKYTKVDVGTSGMFMIDNSTEIIYGIKAYGVVHKGKVYGTLSTIDNFYWGEFRPVKLSKK